MRANPDNPQEREIRDLLRQKKWRKARDLAKPASKTDPARFRPLLIEANVGLARDMLSSGQVSEARQVVSYLKTFAPHGVWSSLETELNLKSGNASAVAADSLRALSTASLPLQERRRAADRLVVSYDPAKTASAGPLAPEVAAVRGALAAISAGRYDEAIEAVRPIARNSLLSDWKLFVKALAAFHRGEREKAKQSFGALEQETLPARAALPYLYWLDEAPHARPQALDEPALEILARFSAPPEVTALLLRAERLWLDHKPEAAYTLLRDGIQSFPSDGQDWVGALTDFAFESIFSMPLDLRNGMFDFIDRQIVDRSVRSPGELMRVLRTMSLVLERSPSPQGLDYLWREYLSIRKKLYGPNPRLESLALEWLGKVFAGYAPKGVNSPPLEPGPRHSKHLPEAIRALEESIRVDPSNLDAHLALAFAYDRARKKRERNRLLDRMTRDFPENTHVLAMAGDRCIERKSYTKALALLERAREHDRIHPGISNSIATARYLVALEQYRAGRLEDARKTLDRVAEITLDKTDDVVRSAWTAWLRRGVLERMYGDARLAASHLDQAKTLAPSFEACSFLGHILWKRFQRPGCAKDPFEGEFRCAHPLARNALLLVRIHDFWVLHGHEGLLGNARKMLCDYVRAAARRAFTRKEAQALIEGVPENHPVSTFFTPFIASILKRDPKDPLFLLYEYRLAGIFDGLEEQKRALNKFMKEAVRRGDDHAIQCIRRELDAVDLPPPMPEFFYEDEDEDEDEDYDFEMEQDEVRSMDPRLLSELKAMLLSASPRELKILRKNRPPGMSEELFDLFLEMVRK